MSEMRIYTVLDATLPATIRLNWSQVRLWVAAPGKREAVARIQDLGIRWREETFAGPVRPGNLLKVLRGLGLLREPAVFAYPIPWQATTPLVQIRTRAKLEGRALMGDVFAGA